MNSKQQASIKETLRSLTDLWPPHLQLWTHQGNQHTCPGLGQEDNSNKNSNNNINNQTFMELTAFRSHENSVIFDWFITLAQKDRSVLGTVKEIRREKVKSIWRVSKGPNGFKEANCLKEPNVCKVTKLCQEVIPSHSINTVKVPPSHLESWPTLIRIDKMNHIDVVEILTDAQWALQGVTMSYILVIN